MKNIIPKITEMVICAFNNDLLRRIHINVRHVKMFNFKNEFNILPLLYVLLMSLWCVIAFLGCCGVDTRLNSLYSTFLWILFSRSTSVFW